MLWQDTVFTWALTALRRIRPFKLLAPRSSSTHPRPGILLKPVLSLLILVMRWQPFASFN